MTKQARNIQVTMTDHKGQAHLVNISGAVNVLELRDGDVVELDGRKWRYIGSGSGNAFFISPRKNAKYTAYTWIKKGTTVASLWDLQKMSTTEAQLRKAHGL